MRRALLGECNGGLVADARAEDGSYLWTRDEVILTSVLDPARSLRLAERFWSKVDRSGDGCWPWTGYVRPGMYGLFYMGERHVLAHRVAYALAYQVLPAETIDHLCMNKECQRPTHLEDVSIGENSRRQMLSHDTCRNGHPWNDQNTHHQLDKRNGRTYRACRACALSRYHLRAGRAS